jgi:hypothetical protein
VAEHPYRRELTIAAPAKRVVVAEAERPPRDVAARAWNDGTTRIRLRPRGHRKARIGYSASALGLAALSLTGGESQVFLPVAVFLAILALNAWRGERIVVTPAAVYRRRRFGRSEVRPLVDVSTVVVGSDDEGPRLDLQLGRERVHLAAGLGYDEATLRWIAQRLRRAIEAAR